MERKAKQANSKREELWARERGGTHEDTSSFKAHHTPADFKRNKRRVLDVNVSYAVGGSGK